MNDGDGPTATGAREIRVHVSAVADHRGERPGPAVITLELRGPAITSAGVVHAPEIRVAAIDPADAPAEPVVAIPGLVNAHTHLDLSGIGPRRFDPGAGFTAWLEMIRNERPTEPEAIRRAVVRGVRLSRAGGVHAVGDIAGAPGGTPSLAPWLGLRRASMPGVSFAEFFAMGDRAANAIERFRDVVRWSIDVRQASPRLGVSPHAPYSVSLEGFDAALGLRGEPRLCTHLAESAEERAFIERGAGPKREMLERLGLWSKDAAAAVGHGLSPVQHLAERLERAPARWLAAHCNDVDDADIALLARHAVSVAYCPRASAYFGAVDVLGPHRYRAMLDAGVNVCLGTDSIVNLDTPDRVSVLDEMRLLFRRDGTDALTLLTMATASGAAALGLDTSRYVIEAGRRVSGLVLVPIGSDRAGLAGGLESDAAPRPIALETGSIPVLQE